MRQIQGIIAVSEQGTIRYTGHIYTEMVRVAAWSNLRKISPRTYHCKILRGLEKKVSLKGIEDVILFGSVWVIVDLSCILKLTINFSCKSVARLRLPLSETIWQYKPVSYEAFPLVTIPNRPIRFLSHKNLNFLFVGRCSLVTID